MSDFVGNTKDRFLFSTAYMQHQAYSQDMAHTMLCNKNYCNVMTMPGSAA